ncbi:MAG: PDZ domain-containing protein [Proteobacteria bacterium]|nr:PDZ domain-containing protein [Pseudomonadota bacterium]
MSLINLFRSALSYTAAALIAASLVASCEMTGGASQPPAATPSTAETSPERVILQAYRLISDRHVNEPDFRKISVETYRGFASADPELSLQATDQTYTILRDGKVILSRPTPTDPADGRAWGALLTELFAASIGASPVLQQSDRNALTKAAMVATTGQLDKNTRYADPEEARDNRFQRDGGGGIGITIERTDNKTIIRAVQDGSPAAKGGIHEGDQILSVDHENMVDRPLIDVVHKLRGPVGAPVMLTVLRPESGQTITAAIRRGRIIPTTVAYERDGNLALIHLSAFNSGTTEALVKAIDKAKAQIGPQLAGIIIDMRGNRGGLLDQAESVAELFISDGVIFSTKGRHPDADRTYRSNSHGHASTLPIVALVNGNSASAAEIVAAALQDRGRAVIVGTTSYGKGTVQTVVRLPNQGELILTWSRLLAPSGYTWNELGVMPNICTAKVADPDKLQPSAVDANRSLLQQWHAERHPSAQEVATLRRICPPGEDLPRRDVEIAGRLLHDPTLYAQAVRLGSVDQAAAPR